jgi:hypothetical protein
MATPTVPTIPFPTPTGDDTDDDDDDDISSILLAQPTPPPVAPAPEQPSPTPPAPIPEQPSPPLIASVPEVLPTSITPESSSSISNVLSPSGSVTPLADNLPTSTPQAESPANDKEGLGVGAKAGIGVGVPVAVIIMLIGIWLFLRRRKWRQQRKRESSRDSKSSNNSRDAEEAHATAGADVRAYRASAVSELSSGGVLTADDKVRRYSELASPVVAQEVHGDREFAAELQGSAVPLSTGQKDTEMWSPNGPRDSTAQSGPQVEKKSGARLFDDAPIEDTDTIIDVNDRPRTVDKKRGV